jgi:serine/threonine protein kinase
VVASDIEAPVREGDILAGKYRVERVLGVGGMGVVVAATHVELDQKVAIKFVLPAAVNDEGLLERFLREARAAVRLKSEHVAKVLDVGKMDTGAPYMVMEYLEGCDLGELVAKNGPLHVETAADYVAQACEAVAEAHSLGIIHRDIKPQNLFLTKRVGGSALIKVLDFGVSKVSIAGVVNLTQTMTVMGSPLYMSPEQMRSARSVDPRSDIWALGVVLYELLSGQVPFHAEQMPELCLKVVTEAPVPIDELRPDVPPAMAAVVMRCLEKDPDKRFNDAAELATALESFVTPASRVSIERARMVMSGARRQVSSASLQKAAQGRVLSDSGRPITGPGTGTQRSDSRGSGSPSPAVRSHASQPSHASHPSDASRAASASGSGSGTQRTPPPWTGTHSDGRKGRGALVAIVLAVVAVLALGAGLLILRARAGPTTDARTPASSATSPSTVPPAVSIATLPTSSVEAPPALSAAPLLPLASATATPFASSSAPRPPPPHGIASAWPTVPTSKASAARPPPPTVRDDDIPAMR